MYRISDEQIEYILDDIRRGGIETEDLQLNLLDHICCIMERELEEEGDFEHLYQQTARRFYKTSMREIEDETTQLLTFKNYYSMKRLMIMSGTLSTAAFIAGSVFKIQHWPGASVLLTLGIASFSLLFLPLLAVLKAREVSQARDKIVLVLTCVLGIIFSVATLFAVQHWPGASVLWFLAIGISAFVLLPIYFFTGIRKPETKLNTILMSILLVGVTGLQFTLMNTRPGKIQDQVRVQNYVNSEVLLRSMRPADIGAKAGQINALCEQLKAIALGPASPDPVNLLHEGRLDDAFLNNGTGVHLMAVLRDAVSAYNAGHSAEVLPTSNTVLSTEPAQTGVLYSNISFLNSITQLQMYLVTAENNSRTASVTK